MSERPNRQKPDGLSPMGRVAQMMNFERIATHPPTLVTMDHRAVLVAAWAAHQESLFGDQLPRLFRLDAHPDLGEKPRPWKWEKSLLTDLHQVTAIANDQRHDDGGWVISAMNFGFCSDVITGCLHDYHRFEGDSMPYEDAFEYFHRMKSFGDLKGALKVFDKWNDFDPAPIWLDLDLDFATNRDEADKITTWTKEDWDRVFTEECCQRFAELAEKASLITISLEPWFCGSMLECGKIAEGLKQQLKGYTSIFDRM